MPPRRKIGKIKLLDDEFEIVRQKYTEFFENNNTCTDTCPLNLHIRDGIDKNLRDLHNELREKSMCFCQMFKDFHLENCRCPCGVHGNAAFSMLETIVKKLNTPEEYADI